MIGKYSKKLDEEAMNFSTKVFVAREMNTLLVTACRIEIDPLC